ncbi:hypothetical protein HY501_03120 [Candidatus Woesearchaeota archaeon]|nr:hypothetical protein [Candidatus Woesearchaeota archaeon]
MRKAVPESGGEGAYSRPGAFDTCCLISNGPNGTALPLAIYPATAMPVMDIYQMKKFLRNIDPQKFKVSSHVRRKIEKGHMIAMEEVFRNLKQPDMLIGIEEQESRRPHESTYGLLFQKSKRRGLFVVITHKTLKKKTYIVTAFPTDKKLKRLIKGPRLRR